MIIFKKEEYPTKEDKIKYLRNCRNISQIELAKGMKCGLSSVQRSETEGRKYTEEEIKNGLKLFGLEGLPLDDKEAFSFKNKLYVFRNSVRDEYFDKAEKLRKELSVIIYAPFYPDLTVLFNSFESRYLLKKEKTSEARKILIPHIRSIKERSKEAQYHYYHMLGDFHRVKGRYKKALKYLHMANDIETDEFEKESVLSYNLALCYSEFGKYVVALDILERAYHQFNHKESNVLTMIFYNELGLNYMRLGHIVQAKEFFHKTYDMAIALKHKILIGFSLDNLGCVYFRAGEHKKAIDYFNKANKQVDEGSTVHLETLYYKALSQMKVEGANYKATIERGLLLAKDGSLYHILFNSLLYYSDINKQESMDYIEHITIPSLLAKYKFSKVFDYYTALEEAYAKKSDASKGARKDYIKSLQISKKAFEIYVIMTNGKENFK